jgi:hypothetical protein
LHKLVHIVCPEIPGPASLGDMADSFFQMALLQEDGYDVILHCFTSDPEADTTQLDKITAGLYLYERNEGHKGVSMRHPYCISSRSHPQLPENILQYPGPVIFQGTGTTFFLPELAANGCKTFVRINGIASERYNVHIKCEKSLLKKAYAYNEARLIRKWEEKIAEYALVIATTACDEQQFRALYKHARTAFLPPYIPKPEVKSLAGTGNYCLYYGDMSNPENEKMAHWLSEHVFSKLPFLFIVADTCGNVKSEEQLHPESNICRICNTDAPALDELIQKAQLVILPRSCRYGFDKRLVQVLAKGRHCICNELMLECVRRWRPIFHNLSPKKMCSSAHNFCRDPTFFIIPRPRFRIFSIMPDPY